MLHCIFWSISVSHSILRPQCIWSEEIRWPLHRFFNLDTIWGYWSQCDEYIAVFGAPFWLSSAGIRDKILNLSLGLIIFERLSEQGIIGQKYLFLFICTKDRWHRLSFLTLTFNNLIATWEYKTGRLITITAQRYNFQGHRWNGVIFWSSSTSLVQKTMGRHKRETLEVLLVRDVHQFNSDEVLIFIVSGKRIQLWNIVEHESRKRPKISCQAYLIIEKLATLQHMNITGSIDTRLGPIQTALIPSWNVISWETCSYLRFKLRYLIYAKEELYSYLQKFQNCVLPNMPIMWHLHLCHVLRRRSSLQKT